MDRRETLHPSIGRRTILKSGLCAAGALSAFWSDWLRAENLQVAAASPAARREAKAKSVILIFNSGAPSHLDLWDMKPRAADNVRGPFQPISTNVPGIQISELLPSLAPHADKLAIVRTVHHRHSSHNAGMYWSIVGRSYPVDSTLINPNRTDQPCFGTLVNWLAQRDGYSQALPPYVITPHPHCDSFQYITPGQFGAFLGARFDPFVVGGDLNNDSFRVANLGPAQGLTRERLFERQMLLGQFEDDSAPWLGAESIRDLAANQGKALTLATANSVAEVFDLSREPTAMREKYGRHPWGQSHLLARRLVEAGAPFVTTVNGPSIHWDTHEDNFGRLKNSLVPPMEKAYAALLDDLAQRGLLDTTLVIWMGDFGRTPKINKNAGRDHWPQCYTVVMAGGGIRGGQYLGESDSVGAAPRVRPVAPADIHATAFKLLGYDAQGIRYQAADGRPMPLTEGEPLDEIL